MLITTIDEKNSHRENLIITSTERRRTRELNLIEKREEEEEEEEQQLKSIKRKNLIREQNYYHNYQIRNKKRRIIMKNFINKNNSKLFRLTVILTSILSIVLIVVTNAEQLIQSNSNNHHHNLHLHSSSSYLPQSQQSSALTISNNNNNNNNNQYQSGLFKDLSGPTSGKIQTLDVICGKNFMTVRAEFSAPFYGIVFSKGTYGQENCIYVKPNSGLTSTAFNVYYDKCGTKPDLAKKFYENTIVIQYGSDIIEAYDEAKRLRCEWFEAYEKPATFKPAIPVADLEVVEMNFQGDDIDCWMEIQEGAGPTSREVSKIVSVGQPMTIVVAINDYNGIFDMRVKSCVAHDGFQQPIALTDEYGCVLRPKMLTPFTKIRNPSSDKKATILSYSRFLAFKFPDSMKVQIQCTVEVCRHGCADACQRVPSMSVATTLQPELSLSAKWPSSPNQPAIGDGNPKRNEQNAESDFKPTRLSPPFNGNNNNRQANNNYNNEPHQPSSSSSDDMSGSDSNQQTNYVTVTPPQQQQQQQQLLQPNTQRRSQSSIPQAQNSNYNFDGRIPQYLMPINSQQHGRRLSASSSVRPPQVMMTTTSAQPPTIITTTSSSPSTTTTIPPTTTTQSGENNLADNNRQNGQTYQEDSPETQPSSISETSTSEQQQQSSSSSAVVVNNNKEQTDSASDINQQQDNQQSQPSVQADPLDNKAEPSNIKLSLALPDRGESVAVPAVAPQNGEQSSSDQKLDNNNNNNNQGEMAGALPEENKQPSVGDELAESNKDQVVSTSSIETNNNLSTGANVGGSSSSSSSLKTVEVEIPSNEDPQINNLLASVNSQISNHQGSSFNSIRLSGNLDSNNQQVNRNYDDNDSSSYKQQNVVEQVIQPRESQQQQQANKRDKLNDGDNLSSSDAITAMMGSGKNRFGARQQQQQPSIVVAAASSPANHQMASVDPAQQDNINKESSIISPTSESVNSNQDKVLIDRSDDSSSLTDLTFTSSSSNDNSESPNKSNNDNLSLINLNAANDEQNSYLDSSSLSSSSAAGGSGGKINPVVGTEELASGPLQIEDRIGAAPAPQESLEEALRRLQQQIPQTAALVSSASQLSQTTQASSSSNSNQQQQQQHQQADQKSAINNENKPDQRTDGVAQIQTQSQSTSSSNGGQQQSSSSVLPLESSQKQSSVTQEVKSDIASERFDLGKKVENQQQLRLIQQQHQNQKFNGDGNVASNQPYPNVVGQAKVMPDPTSSLNTRGSLVAQASNEAIPSVLPAVQLQQQQQGNPIANIAQQQKPVAQITNVPIAIGIPQDQQIPTIQQLQQMAFYQQQQQQQQMIKQNPQLQQQILATTTTTTAKPSIRGRFNLLSPQAALHAVASRFLPKSTSTSAPPAPNVQQQPTLPLAKQLPQLLTNIKLLPEQQKLTPQQQQQQQQNFFLQQQQQGQQQPQQYQVPNRFVQPQQQQQQQQQSVAGGLFSRFRKTEQSQQQPLIRSRRSALLPNGKQQGTGEVGITKSFMVVTNMDLAFAPNLTSPDELPEILQGRRLMVEDDEEVIYGVYCMPVFSLTFVLTCAIWLIIFLIAFCIYIVKKTRSLRRGTNCLDQIVKK